MLICLFVPQLQVQCDQIGQFLKFLLANFISKVAQISGDFLDHFGNNTFKVKSAVAVFGQSLVEIGQLFSPTSGRTGGKPSCLPICLDKPSFLFFSLHPHIFFSFLFF